VDACQGARLPAGSQGVEGQIWRGCKPEFVGSVQPPTSRLPAACPAAAPPPAATAARHCTTTLRASRCHAARLSAPPEALQQRKMSTKPLQRCNQQAHRDPCYRTPRPATADTRYGPRSLEHPQWNPFARPEPSRFDCSTMGTARWHPHDCMDHVSTSARPPCSVASTTPRQSRQSRRSQASSPYP
jgi:hypothetical protein